MLTTIAIILVILWIFGLLAHVAGGLIHIVLVIAVILFIARLIQGKKVL